MVKLDDTFADHPLIAGVSDGAFRLYVNALLWSAKYDTGRQIPAGVLRQLRGTPRFARELVSRGLWDATHEGWSVVEGVV